MDIKGTIHESNVHEALERGMVAEQSSRHERFKVAHWKALQSEQDQLTVEVVQSLDESE
jgi:hypothetical protein